MQHYKTLTYQNLTSKSQNVVLQILSKENISLIRQLGKKSGNKFKKDQYLEKNKFVEKWNNHIVLKYFRFIELKIQKILS